MSKELNMAEAQALIDKMAMEDPSALVRAIAGETPKSNGGAAFPQSESVGDLSITHGGMSLRDYFAAKAVVGLMGRSWNNITGAELIALWATSAYAMADAMLAERAK